MCARILALLVIFINLSFCSDNNRENSMDDELFPLPSIYSLPDKIYTRVYPSVIIREKPSVKSAVVTTLPFHSVLEVDTSRGIPEIRNTFWDMRGYWIPVSVPDNTHTKGWIFSPLVRFNTSIDQCYIATGNALESAICTEMIETQKLHCHKFNIDSFPEAFKGGCMNFDPLHFT
jgi:hypothetical protein